MCIVCSTFDLVVVVVESGDMCARELCNLSRRATNATSDIKDALTVAQLHLCCEVVLVASNGLVEILAIGVAAEVE